MGSREYGQIERKRTKKYKEIKKQMKSKISSWALLMGFYCVTFDLVSLGYVSVSVLWALLEI